PRVFKHAFCERCEIREECPYNAILRDVMKDADKCDKYNHVRVACTHALTNTPWFRALVEKIPKLTLVYDEAIGYNLLLKSHEGKFEKFSRFVKFYDTIMPLLKKRVVKSYRDKSLKSWLKKTKKSREIEPDWDEFIEPDEYEEMEGETKKRRVRKPRSEDWREPDSDEIAPRVDKISELLHVLDEHDHAAVISFIDDNIRDPAFGKTFKDDLFKAIFGVYEDDGYPAAFFNGFAWLDVLFDIFVRRRGKRGKHGKPGENIENCVSFNREKVFIGVKNIDLLETMKAAHKLAFLDATQNRELLAAYLDEDVPVEKLVVRHEYPVYQLDEKEYGMKYLSEHPTEMEKVLELVVRIIKHHALDQILIVSRVGRDIQDMASEYLTKNEIEHEIVKNSKQRRVREKTGHEFSKRVVLDHWPL
nr:hypothetical protein [Candidatus Sigynarchaeota archaeon]